VFKVMSWNLENLFRPGSPSGPSSSAAYTTKLDGLAAVINGQAPDALTSDPTSRSDDPSSNHAPVVAIFNI
jgi:hypothetical protein